MPSPRDPPRILVIIPCLNEEAHLPALLRWLENDPLPARIVVADGGSRDSGPNIVQQAAARDPRIALLDNPKRLQSAGVNLAAQMFGGDADFIVRVDAHAAYPTDFLTRLVSAQTETDADSVTVSMRACTHGDICFQRAAAVAQNSILGAGGSPHRRAGERRWVDHGHHALLRKDAFLAVGGYDESFTHNEDAEVDLRLVNNGARILLAGDIVIDYFPRTRISDLARQYFNHGRGRARTTIKHKQRPKLRQLAPASIAPIVALAILAGPFFPVAALPGAAWLALCIGYGAMLGVRERNLCAGVSGVAAATMHAGWSAGFLYGVAEAISARVGARS